MSQSSIQRKREANRQARDEKLASHLINGIHTYKSLNLTMEDAFQAVVRRVSWLNDKITWSQANCKGFHLYVIERESLLLLVDKVKELSERLLSQSKSVNKTFVGKDSASGGYPFETNSIQSATIWRTGEEANECKLIPGFKSFGSDRWEIKTLYYR